MRSLILISLLLSAPAYAARGWWGRACDMILLSRARDATPPRTILKVEAEMQDEIYRINRGGPHHLSVHHTPLDFYNNRPVSVEILPQLSADYQSVRRIDMRLFANPEAVGLEWKDEGKDLSAGPSLVLMYEDAPVRTSSGEGTLTSLVQEEFQNIIHRNPGMHAKILFKRARELNGMHIRHEYANHMIAWIEGEISNFQVKRIMALMMDYAFGQAASDQRYAMRKPEPPPTQH